MSARRRSISWRRVAGESAGGAAFVSPLGFAPRPLIPQPPMHARDQHRRERQRRGPSTPHDRGGTAARSCLILTRTVRTVAPAPLRGQPTGPPLLLPHERVLRRRTAA